jgi:methanogenic corrinoid protein MtbC1
MRFDRSGAVGLVEEYLETGGDVVGAYCDVLMPAMRHVGAEWEADRLSVAHEHYVSEVTRDLIQRLGSRVWVEVDPAGPLAVAGCVPGERHVLGLLMIRDILRVSGVRVHLLGEGAPAEAIRDFVLQTGADWLCLSCTLPVHLPEAADVVAMARGVRPGLKVLFGGAAFHGSGCARALGGDHYASDLRELQGLLPVLLNGGGGKVVA